MKLVKAMENNMERLFFNFSTDFMEKPDVYENRFKIGTPKLGNKEVFCLRNINKT